MTHPAEPHTDTSDQTPELAADVIATPEESLVEEVSIDGMCGVY